MNERLIFAGSGGQGVLTLGKLLAEAAMSDGIHVTYFPSYGSEVRGGTAHCNVVVSGEEIFSPIVEHANAMVIMNQPSLDKFLPRLSAGGLLLVNSTMARPPSLADGVVLPIPATALASEEIGEVRAANMIMLGALLARKSIAAQSKIESLLTKKLAGKDPSLTEKNHRALSLGARLSNES